MAEFSVGGDLSDLLSAHERLGEDVQQQALILAEHQGTLKGVFPTISAIQSSLGAWLAVVGIVTSVLVGLAIFNLTRTNAIGDQVSAQATAQSQRLGGVEDRLGAVENRLAVLPQAVVQQLNNQPATSSAPAPRRRRKR